MYKFGPCIPIFRGFFIKNTKKMCICEYVKKRIGTYKNCVFRFEEGYKQIIALDSCKTYCLVSLLKIYFSELVLSL